MNTGTLYTHNSHLISGKPTLTVAFLLPPKVNPARISDPVSPAGAFSLLTTHAGRGRNMRNNGQVACAELMEEDVKLTKYDEWNPNGIPVKRDASRYEQIIHQTRVRLGLERG